jgi:hypothetical protein
MCLTGGEVTKKGKTEVEGGKLEEEVRKVVTVRGWSCSTVEEVSKLVAKSFRCELQLSRLG